MICSAGWVSEPGSDWARYTNILESHIIGDPTFVSLRTGRDGL